MKTKNITVKVDQAFKDRFKAHCGLVDMSKKIRDLIETDMNKNK